MTEDEKKFLAAQGYLFKEIPPLAENPVVPDPETFESAKGMLHGMAKNC